MNKSLMNLEQHNFQVNYYFNVVFTNIPFTNHICPAFVSTDRERIALGTEDGLFVVEITRDGMSTLYSTDLVLQHYFHLLISHDLFFSSHCSCC